MIERNGNKRARDILFLIFIRKIGEREKMKGNENWARTESRKRITSKSEFLQWWFQRCNFAEH